MRAAVSRGANRLGRRLGPRGAGLLLCGVGWIVYGCGLLGDPRFGIVRGVDALVRVAPISVWGWVWIASGVVACLAAPLQPREDWWGWLAAAAMPGVWAVAYTSARALGTLAQGWYSGTVWAVFPGLLMILAWSTRRIVCLTREVDSLRRGAATGEHDEGAQHG